MSSIDYIGDLYPENIEQPVFTTDWFSNNIKQWDKYKSYFDGKPDMHCLELGSYQGRSTLYTVKNFCNGKGSYVDAVDTWEGSIEHSNQEKVNLQEFFVNNTRQYLAAGTIKMHKGFSSDYLIKFVQEVRAGNKAQYDFIYIDASHMAKDVMMDAILSWEMLKIGGIMAFDDYKWKPERESHRVPKVAIDAFLEIYTSMFDILHKDYQVHLKKMKVN